MITLDSIINDLLYTIRGSKVTQSEKISRRQIEAWIHQYRALLIKQDLNKGKIPNPDYIQTLPNVELEIIDLATEEIETDHFKYRTKYVLPKTIDLNHKLGITYISNLFGDEIQLVNEARVNWQKYRRFTANDKLAYLKDGYLYIHDNNKLLKYITMSGIFENPLLAANFDNKNRGLLEVGLELEYPIPSNMLPTLKEMVLSKELGIVVSAPSDNKVDSAPYVSGNISGGAKQGEE